MSIFNVKQFYKLIFPVLFFSTFIPSVVHSACGNIPGTYPLFNTDKITLEEEFEVNGNEREYEDPFTGNKAISRTGSVSTVSLTLPDLDPASFPNNSSSTDLSYSSNTTLNNSSEAFYNKISIDSGGITVNFTGGGAVHINEFLINNSNVTLNFEAGTYYIDKIVINGSNTTFNTSSTPVIFHIGTEFTISSSGANLNSGGSVDEFRVYLHSGAKVDSSGANVNFTGLIYGPSNVSLVKFAGTSNSIHGAIITAGGEIDITGEDSTLTYSTADQTAIGNISTCQSSTPTPDPTPILEYKFDACSLDSSVEDTQGNYNGIATGTDSSDSTSVLGGRSLDLSATDTSDWVTVPKSAVTGLTDFSFSAWIKTGTSSFQQEIFQALGSSTGDDELEISLNYTNSVIFTLRSSDNNLSANKTLTDNIWHHLVLTRQGSTVCLYVDGSQTDCDSSATTGTLSVNYANSVVIGQEQDSTRSSASLNSGFDSSQSFKGYIDELKIYDSVLSSSQVQTLFNDESSGDNTSDCIGGGGSSCVTFRDEFSTESYSRQDGTANWSTNWNEVSDNGSASTGDIEIANSKLQFEAEGSGSTALGAPYIERQADLSNYTTATLSFDYSANEDWADEENDEVEIYASSNGGSTWTLIHTFTGSQSSSTNQFSQDITSYISSNTRIAFVEKGREEDARFYFDNVQIEACAVVGGGDTPATAFNCVENGSNGISGNLYTKTTAQSFSFDIVALQDASTIETSFASGADHTVTVELVNAETVASCDNYPVLSPAVSQSLTMASTDAGTKASATMTSGTAYSTVKCRVTDATDSPPVMGCSTDSFAIRPTTYTVTSPSLLQTTTPTASATPATKAGETFSLEFSGYTDKPNKIDDTKITDHSGAISGVLSGSLTGNQFTGNFTYSEVGWFLLDTNAIYDDIFTAVDQPDDCTNNFSNTPDVNGKVGCKFGNTANPNYFGRFIPDHFEITGSQNGVFSDACTGFTYTGQAFSYQTNPTLTVTAYNGLGAITKNYTGSYRKLSATDFDVTTPITDTTQMGADGSNLVNLQWTPGTPALADNGDGSVTFTLGADDYIYQHEGNSKIVPFTPTVDLEFSNITDSESVPTQGLPHVIQASGTSLRFGRLSIDNAHGSELLPLALQLTTEYYDGSNYIKNTADSCTSFALATDFSISDPADLNCSLASNTSPVSIGSTGQVKAVMANTTASNGVTEITVGDNTDVTKGPGAGNTGYVEITSNLLTNLPWLRFNWDDTGSAYDDCPSARATFGIFKGNEQQIYFREVY